MIGVGALGTLVELEEDSWLGNGRVGNAGHREQRVWVVLMLSHSSALTHLFAFLGKSQLGLCGA